MRHTRPDPVDVPARTAAARSLAGLVAVRRMHLDLVEVVENIADRTADLEEHRTEAADYSLADRRKEVAAHNH